MRASHASEDSAIRLIALGKMQFGWIIGQALPYQCLGAIFLDDGATLEQLDDGVKTAVLHDWLQVYSDAGGHFPRMVTLTERGDQAKGSSGGFATAQLKRRL